MLTKFFDKYISPQPYSIRHDYEIFSLFIILVIGLIMRLYKIDALSLWLDESFTYYATKLPFDNLMSFEADINNPPIYYMLQKFFLQLGSSEFNLRIGSALFGSLSILLVHLIGRKFVNPLCGLVAAAIIATSSTQIEYSQEARSYALLFLELSIASYGFIGFIVSAMNAGMFKTSDLNKIKYLAIYFIGALTALYTHNITVYYWLIFNIIAIIFYRPWKQISDASLIEWILLNGALFILWLPWLFYIIRGVNTFSWLEQYTLKKAFSKFLDVQGFAYIKSLQSAFNIFVLLCALAGAIIAFFRKKYVIGIFILSILILVPCLIWLTGFVKPVFMTRTIIFSGIGSALAIGITVVFLRNRYIALTIISAILLINFISAFNYYQNHKKEEWRSATKYLENVISKDDAVLLCANYMYFPFRYYYKNDINMYGWFGDKKIMMELSDSAHYFAASNPMEVADLNKLFNKIWIIKSHCQETDWDALGRELDKAGWQEVQRKDFYRIDLIIYKFD